MKIAEGWSLWMAAFDGAISTDNAGLGGCPHCGHHELHLKVVGDPATRLAYGAFWCSHCNRGVWLSRFEAPAAVDLVAPDSPDKDRQFPDFDEVIPARDEGKVGNVGVRIVFAVASALFLIVLAVTVAWAAPGVVPGVAVALPASA